MADDDRSLAKRAGTDAVVETASSVVGALVGLAIGGPPGAVIGAAAPPTVSIGARLSAAVIRRKWTRGERILDEAFARAALTPDEVAEQLLAEPDIAEDFVRLIKVALDSDHTLAGAFSELLARLLREDSDVTRQRVAILAEAIGGLRTVDLAVICSLRAAGGSQPAAHLADGLGLSEIDLRGVVRNLELRGIIRDDGQRPLSWQLRELGVAISTLLPRPEH